MEYFTKTIEDSIELTKSTKNGLTSAEAKDRLLLYGENKIPIKKRKSKILRFFAQFRDVMIIILLISAIVSISVSVFNQTYSEMIDGFIILAIVLINAIIGFVQELKAEKEMKALLSISEPMVKVKRNNHIEKIHISEIVVGDIVILETGDIVPADLRLVESVNLKCDESSLTGESVAVEKNSLMLCKETTPLAERQNMAYKGSVVMFGRGEGLVVKTGKDTEIGKIATMLNTTEKSETPLQKNIKLVGKIITIIVLIIASITFLLEVLFKPEGNILDAFLTAVAISVAAIPESLPAVITIIMSMGVARLSKKKAIVKRLHAVETLGSTQIICSDKTGTLTQNSMTVSKLYFNQKILNGIQNENGAEKLLNAMVLCNDSVKNENSYLGDPTEIALTVFAEQCGKNKKEVDKNYRRIGEIPFDSTRKLMTTVNINDKNVVSYTKGAPDVILNKCTKVMINGQVVPLTKTITKEIEQANKQMGSDALRVLGFAIKEIRNFQERYSVDEIEETDLIFLGLVGMIDPPRREVKDAVKKCKDAKMIPIMITGDHKNTAFAIAKQIGICENENQVLLGSELDKLSDDEYKKIIYNIKVYARVSPENKVRIVKTFKQLGNVVAMTGDGVNDAPSLKTADIGVGMGITGTDVTKEVADIIVTDDNFATIIVAVEEGRRIYANIKKTITFLFSANMAEILSLFFATILFPNLTFLLPVQILFVNMITDSLPAIALGLEPPEKNLMTKAPRKSNKTIFSNGSAIQIVTMGILQTVVILLAFGLGYKISGSQIVATSMAFYTLNLCQFGYLISMRVNSSVFKNNFFANKWIWLAIGFGIIVVALLSFTPFGTILGLTNITINQWLIVLSLSFSIFALSEIVKLIIKKELKK